MIKIAEICWLWIRSNWVSFILFFSYLKHIDCVIKL